ncbi:hypothetical protein EMPG_13701 [Blastomyces silverae]|uniref:Uncharacterized protein n=1 Tax=Blastomyces silverae TaxID=2060906 RepID=A0A0H1BIZ6_9EURO|nr:hypothetical protein EMPG_13701 [Blastomyces silverae]
MSFAILPLEIVLEIASHLKSECDINSLAQTDRRLYMILNPYLLKYHITQNRGRAALLWAAQTGDEALAKLLLSYNDTENCRVDPNCTDDMYWLTPRTIAAIKGHTNIVKLLHGTPGTAFVEFTITGRTPLSFAVENGHVEIVKFLIDNDELSAAKDWVRWRPLLLWATTPRPLLGDGGELYCKENDQTKMTKSSRLRAHYDHQQPGFITRHWYYYSRLLPPDSPPLQWMPMPAYEAIVDLLLKDRGALEATDRYGRTALCWAAECGYEEGVEVLLKKGAALQPPGRSPLLFAVANDHASIVRMLLERDTAQTLHTVSDGGVTPLNLAASGGHEEIVKLFLQKTVHQEHACFGSGWRPLIEASREGHTGVVELLLAEQARRWPGYSSLWQPLFWAAYGGYDDIVRLLLAAGASVDVGQFVVNNGGSTDPFLLFDGSTPLSAAAMRGHTLVAELLLEIGKCDVNTRDQHGWTPLTWAARSSDEGMVYLLLENGADSEFIDPPSPPGVFRYGVMARYGTISPEHVASQLSSVDGDEAPHYFFREALDSFGGTPRPSYPTYRYPVSFT